MNNRSNTINLKHLFMCPMLVGLSGKKVLQSISHEVPHLFCRSYLALFSCDILQFPGAISCLVEVILGR